MPSRKRDYDLRKAKGTPPPPSSSATPQPAKQTPKELAAIMTLESIAGVDPLPTNPSFDELMGVYRKARKQAHPDRLGGERTKWDTVEDAARALGPARLTCHTVHGRAFRHRREYIASFPGEVQAILEDVRSTIKNAVPGSGETIRYQMPCVMLGDRYLVHYAGWTKHIGLYPVPVADADLERIAPLRSDKDTVKLMYDDRCRTTGGGSCSSSPPSTPEPLFWTRSVGKLGRPHDREPLEHGLERVDAVGGDRDALSGAPPFGECPMVGQPRVASPVAFALVPRELVVDAVQAVRYVRRCSGAQHGGCPGRPSRSSGHPRPAVALSSAV